MKINNVSVSLGLKANLGNYNNASVFYTLGAELEEGDDPQACKEEVEAIVDGWVSDKLTTIKAANGQ